MNYTTSPLVLGALELKRKKKTIRKTNENGAE